MTPEFLPDLATRLVPALQPEPEQHWEGTLKGDRGASRDRTVSVAARIVFWAGTMEGQGAASDFPAGAPADARRFQLSGDRNGEAVRFSLWFADPDIARTPFECVAVLNEDADELEGAWSFGCFYPQTCGCGGGGGTLRLWRVTED
jgi:hypothetical protein